MPREPSVCGVCCVSVLLYRFIFSKGTYASRLHRSSHGTRSRWDDALVHRKSKNRLSIQPESARHTRTHTRTSTFQPSHVPTTPHRSRAPLPLVLCPLSSPDSPLVSLKAHIKQRSRHPHHQSAQHKEAHLSLPTKTPPQDNTSNTTPHTNYTHNTTRHDTISSAAVITR